MIIHLVEPTGKQDFFSTPKMVTFPPSSNQSIMAVEIDVVNDTISERQEGFFILLEVVNQPESSMDVVNIGSQNVTLGSIIDDDSKSVFYLSTATIKTIY